MKKLRIGVLTDRQPVGQWEEIAATVLSVLQNLFSNADPGHWDATHTHFIPGDLNNRLATASQWIAQAGVQSVFDQTQIYNILTSTGIWQNALQTYIAQLKTGLANGTITPNNNSLIQAGFDSSTILLLGLIAGGIYMIYKGGAK